jgi:hypothetical protein
LYRNNQAHAYPRFGTYARAPIKGMMENYDSYLNQEISWNEFEVVVRNCTHAVRFENRALRNKVRDFHVHARHNSRVVMLDTKQALDCSCTDDDLGQMEDFRVKRNNVRFGFSVENPSDADAGIIADETYREHNSNLKIS